MNEDRVIYWTIKLKKTKKISSNKMVVQCLHLDFIIKTNFYHEQIEAHKMQFLIWTILFILLLGIMSTE